MNSAQGLIKNKTNIIWDYNGTMLDDVFACILSINKMLRERNIPEVDEDNYKAYFDFPVKEYYQRIGFDFEKESFDVVGKYFVDLYDEHRYDCNLHPLIRETLELFNSLGKRQYVLSARQDTSLIHELEFHKIDSYFTGVYGLKDLYAYGKTDLGIQMMKDLELDPNDTIMIGDTCHDAEVAHAMGIDSILLSYGHHHKHRLEKCSSIVIPNLEVFH